jgi:hypothetical protein
VKIRFDFSAGLDKDGNIAKSVCSDGQITVTIPPRSFTIETDDILTLDLARVVQSLKEYTDNPRIYFDVIGWGISEILLNDPLPQLQEVLDERKSWSDKKRLEYDEALFMRLKDYFASEDYCNLMDEFEDKPDSDWSELLGTYPNVDSLEKNTIGSGVQFIRLTRQLVENFG